MMVKKVNKLTIILVAIVMSLLVAGGSIAFAAWLNFTQSEKNTITLGTSGDYTVSASIAFDWSASAEGDTKFYEVSVNVSDTESWTVSIGNLVFKQGATELDETTTPKLSEVKAAYSVQNFYFQADTAYTDSEGLEFTSAPTAYKFDAGTVINGIGTGSEQKFLFAVTLDKVEANILLAGLSVEFDLIIST